MRVWVAVGKSQENGTDFVEVRTTREGALSALVEGALTGSFSDSVTWEQYARNYIPEDFAVPGRYSGRNEEILEIYYGCVRLKGSDIFFGFQCSDDSAMVIEREVL